MQFEEESPQPYVDIARAPDKEMRPQAGAFRLRFINLPLGDGRRRGVVARRPVPPGCGQDGPRRAEQCLRPWA